MKDKKSETVLCIYKDGRVEQNNGMPHPSIVNYKEIENFLIPVMGDRRVRSFIPVPVTKLSTATRVRMNIQMKAYYFSDAVREYNVLLDPIEIDTDNLIDVYNYLFSFLRYEMLNSLEGVYMNEDIPMESLIEPHVFSLEIYNEDDLIYSTNIDSDDSSVSKYAKIDKLINKFFKFNKNPLFGKYDKEKVCRILNGHAEIVPISLMKNKDLIGVGSPFIRTITFMEANHFSFLKHSIKHTFINFYHVDRNAEGFEDVPEDLEYYDSIGLDIIPLKSMSYWANDIYTMIGFIDHLSYYAQLLDVMINLLYKEAFPEKYSTMNIETVVLLEVEFLSIRCRRMVRKYKLGELPSLGQFIDDLNGYAPYL